MTAEVIPLHREGNIRPELAKIWAALDLVTDDAGGDLVGGGLFATAVAGLRAAQINQGRGNTQGVCNSLTLAFFALATLLGVPRSDTEDMLPD